MIDWFSGGLRVFGAFLLSAMALVAFAACYQDLPARLEHFVFYRFVLSTIRFQTKAFYLNLMVKKLYKKNKNDDDDQIIFF